MDEIDRSYMDVNAIKEKSIVCVELLFGADDKIRFDQSRFMQTGKKWILIIIFFSTYF